MSNAQESKVQEWRMNPGRVHGRLALLYWKPGAYPLPQPASNSASFDYLEGSITINQTASDRTILTLRPRQEDGTQTVALPFDNNDWQGIIEGYYEVDGILRYDREPWVWIGHHRISKKGSSTKAFETLCSNAQRLLQRVRSDKETFHPWLPIGTRWGFISIWEYLAIRAAHARNKVVPRPFGSTHRHHSDFGYQTVMSPKLMLREFHSIWQQRRSVKSRQ